MNIMVRMAGGILAFGNIFGLAWFFHDHMAIEWIPPAVLMLLAITPRRILKRLWPLTLAGASSTVFAYWQIGVPLVRSYSEFSAELLFAIEFLLIAYFFVLCLKPGPEPPLFPNVISPDDHKWHQ